MASCFIECVKVCLNSFPPVSEEFGLSRRMTMRQEIPKLIQMKKKIGSPQSYHELKI